MSLRINISCRHECGVSFNRSANTDPQLQKATLPRVLRFSCLER